ncbi:MAG: bluetail domain-containing putative surface protein [Cyanobacteria bacterium P01_G01_bin.39]
MTEFSIQPPTSLSLDVDRDGDLDLVRQGSFNVTEATAYYVDEDGKTISSQTIIDNTVPTVSRVATIGSGNQVDLFSYPDATEVLRVVGFFDPIAVEGRTGDGGTGDIAYFDVLVGEYGQGEDRATIYLPKYVSFAGYQITDLGVNQGIYDNSDFFSEVRPVLATSAFAPELKELAVLDLNNGAGTDKLYAGFDAPISTEAFAVHGTTRGLGGGGFGDPHLYTLDGFEYDFHAAGEFKLVESVDDDFAVQVRTEHIDNKTTYFTAAATKVDGQRVAFYANQEDVLLIDGKATDIDSGESIQVGDGLITRDQNTYTVTYDNGDASSDPEQLIVHRTKQPDSSQFHLNIETFVADHREGSLVGLLGNNNGIAEDDLALSDGTVLTAPVNFDEFYTDFANGWQIEAEESLFDYVEGKDTSTYRETNFFEDDNVIAGLDSNDLIAGGAGDDQIIGRDGADRLTGDSGKDIFTYKSLAHSSLAGFDTITDLSIGMDKIDGVYSVDAADVVQLAAVKTFDEAGIQNVLTEAAFMPKGAATFTYDSQTFLALNDQVAGYSAADDALIDITGFAGSLADLAIA